MKTRTIKSLTVSPIGMGCMGFSHGYGKVPEESYSIDAIRKAHDFGCNFFDTAESYGREQFFPGHNEQLVGKAVESFRKDIILATKLHIATEETENKKLYDVIRSHLEKSLLNLKTDYVDLYYLHRINEDLSLKEIASVMGQLRQEGLIREWGLSQVNAKQIKEADDVTPVGAVQNLYSMVERDCETDVFPYCLEHNIAVVPFSPIASGFLSGKVTTETKFEGDDVRKFVPQLSKENLNANQPVLDLLKEYATEKHPTNAQISLAWMLKKYENCIPIPGSRSIEHILENLNAWNVELTDEEFTRLDNALNSIEVHGHRGIAETQQNSFSKNWRNKQ